jgi:hypothetical protein
MNHYHPIRLELVERLQQKRQDANAAQLQKRLLHMMTAGETDSLMLVEDDTFLKEQRRAERFDEGPDVEWKNQVILDIGQSRTWFNERGRNIFDMALVSEMLSHVDVDDLVLIDTPLPYPAIYMHFGQEAGLAVEDERWIEGAYVRNTMDDEGPIALTFVCNHRNWRNAENVPLGETFDEVASAVSIVIGRGTTVKASIAARKPSGYPALLASPALSSAIRMAANGLLYINLPRPDIEFDYSADAPRALIAQALGAKGSKAAEARKRLDTQGYVRVNFCGRAFERATIAATAASPQAARSAAQPHWRRGHWRRVVVGQGRLGREWRLFEATMVNLHGGEPIKRGRIHVVQPRTDETGR